MISLTKFNDKCTDYVKVYLKKEHKASGFKDKTNLMPYENGFVQIIDPKVFKAYAQAGRKASSLGISKLALICDKKLKTSTDDIIAYINGLFNLKEKLDIALELDNIGLDKKDLEKISTVVNLHAEYRMLANSSAKEASPLKLAHIICENLTKAAKNNKFGKLECKLISRKDKDFEQFAGMSAVGLASDNDPVMLICDFIPNGKQYGEDIELALIGKGITFDTGGYDLKPSNYMATMRTDKSGAVYLAGALNLAILSGLKTYVRLYLCLCENMVGSRGMLPGDIITYSNKLTVEVTNTDAEGRLVLADALIHASNSNVKRILDAATLTGAAKYALGRNMIAAFNNQNQLDSNLIKAFESKQEDFWLMPYRDYHKQMLSSQRADIQNAPSGDGIPGASTAFAFLDRFVTKGIDFTHLDLASAYSVSANNFFAQGSTGEGILSIATYLLSLTKKQKNKKDKDE